MSTNYYLMTTNKKLVEKYFPCEYELTDSPYFGYQIHIGKRSMGWKPLFESHPLAYNSVSELIEFIQNHQKDIKIYDEYAVEFTLEGLKGELIDWGEQQPKRKLAYNGGDLREDPNGEIDSPIDHVAYANYEKFTLSRRHYVDVKYWHDKDGYDFTDRSFS